MKTCLQCQTPILTPRTSKGRVIQKFCSPRCKEAYHNQPRTRKHIKMFMKELNDLLTKYRMLE